MDPARPNEPEPSDPFNPERADHAIIETIEIATEGEDCDECVRKLRPVLMKINGVQEATIALKRERVVVRFDARKTHPPDLHDALLKSGYKPAAQSGLSRSHGPVRRQTQTRRTRVATRPAVAGSGSEKCRDPRSIPCNRSRRRG